MSKRIISAVLILAMLLGMFPMTAFATESPAETVKIIETPVAVETQEEETTEPTEETLPTEAAEVTRAQWLQMLVSVFKYTIDKDVTLDNYYTDLSAEADYYNDVMTAVYYGLVDVLPGGPMQPEEAATREFAAYTLNSCMGYLPEEELSFSEAETVTYPEDIQVAVERGWFALVDGAFLPEQAITLAEADAMMADAEGYAASMIIDQSHDNRYQFSDDVIEILDAVEIDADSEGSVVTITDCSQTIAVGDKFVAYYNGLAIPYTANEVTVSGSDTIITATYLDFADAVESMDVQTEMDTDPTNFYAAEDTDLIFIEESTGEAYASAEAAAYAMRTSSINVVVPKFSKKIEVRDGVNLTVSMELKKPKICMDTSYDASKVSCSIWLDSNVETTVKLSTELTGLDGDPLEIYVGGYNIPGVGGLSLYIKISITGTVSVVQKHHMKVGVTASCPYGGKMKTNMLFEMTEKGSSVNAELTAKVCLEAKFGLTDKALPLRGYFYGEVGFKAQVKYTTYKEIEGSCTNFAAYLYAEYGFKLEWGLFGTTDSRDLKKEYYKESNSPVKVGAHYEDGRKVAGCTRGDYTGTTVDSVPAMENGGGGFRGYNTSSSSSYAGSGLCSGSSTGYTSGGEPVIIYTYTLDEDSNATIIGYSGNATSLTIPLSLDGYSVTAIGANAFKNNTTLRTVVMQDNIRTIGASAFYGCSNLRNLTLSESLTTIGSSAFRNCTSLKSVTLPNSLNVLSYGAFQYCTTLQRIYIPKGINTSGLTGANSAYLGPFYGCSKLNDITFGEGITNIPEGMFYGCTGLEEIVIPATVTSIKDNAFKECTNLKNVTFSEVLTSIGNNAFFKCVAITEVTLPNSMELLECGAFQYCTTLQRIYIPKGINTSGLTGANSAYLGPFYGCSKLNDITFGEGITNIPEGMFYGCTGLEEIVIPDSVTAISDFAFRGCADLHSVTLSNSLTIIEDNAFQSCSSLEEILIPDTVTEIGSSVFESCSSLVKIVLPPNLKALGQAVFKNCSALVSINIPKSLTNCGIHTYSSSGIFYGCTSLRSVVLEAGITKIPGYLFDGSSIESITIPDSVTAIGDCAFRGCADLHSVTLSNSLTIIENNAFQSCSSIEEILIPDTVTEIGSSVFESCSNLVKIDLPPNLKEMGQAVFKNCSALVSINIPKSLTNCGIHTYSSSGIFYGCTSLRSVVLEAGITKIPGYLFDGSSIESITIPDSVTAIGDCAFRGCAKIKEIMIPDSVQSLSTYVFENCTALETVTCSNRISTIPNYTFSGCTALTTVNLPDNLKVINKYAFSNCDALVTFTIPDSVTTMAENVFYDCDALTSITIPYGVTSIGNSAFYDCDALETVDMANSVTSLGTNVFYHNDVLKNVKLSRNLTSIPSGTFKECASLEEIVIPYFTTSIGANAFNSSPKLTKVVTHEKLTSISTSAFSYADRTVFYGPTGSYTETWCGNNGYTFNENAAAATSVTLAENTVSIAKGKTYQLNFDIAPTDFADSITFRSSNTDVVTVDETGKLTAVATGSATIRINVGSASASCKVTVTQAVTKLTLNKKTLDLEVPNTYQLTATITPTDATNQVLSWTSSNESAATVDENGLITAVGNGTAVITATTTDGSNLSASCTVTVIDPYNIPVESVTLGKTALSIEALEAVQLTATVKPDDAANKALIWTSSDESVATVDANGIVTGVKKGTATITATAADGYGASASCTVTVTNTAHIVEDPADLESSHNYPVNCTDFWLYTAPGAETLFVTFDERTYIEDEFDYLYIYDGNGTLVGQYTGDQLAGVTVEVPGDTVKIQLDSDDIGTEWGFKVTEVKARKQTETIASGWSGYTTWVLTDDGVLTFSGEGAMKNYTNKNEMPWYSYFDQITKVVIEEGVTSIGSVAFYGAPNLESISIPDTVTTIGDYAFKNAPKINNVVLPKNLTSLGDSAFYACTSLTSIEIPASLWTIKPYTFKNCTALASVKFNEGNLMKISDGAFYGTALTELVLPDCLDVLDVYSFKGCSNLASITIGDGLTEIREAVFYGTAISQITIPKGITKIGPYAFKNCVNLETVSLPETLTSVGEASFYACTALKGVDFPDKVTTIGNYAFRKCAAMTSVNFGSELTTIGECSFYGCTGLTELVIPDKVTAIKPYAFKGCTALTSVTLGSSVTTLGDSAFHTCTGLKTILFPASLASIGDYCFSGSYNLWKLTFQGDAPAIGTSAFKSMVAFCYYPGDNATWTSDIMQNYGGTITWKAN